MATAPDTTDIWAPARRRGRLKPGELAAGALLVDVCVGLCLIGWLLPFGGVAVAVAVTPVAALAARYRLRATVGAAVAGMVVATLVVGPGLAGNVAGCAVIGGLVGRCHRRGWGRIRTVVAAVVIVWPPVAALAIIVMALFSAARTLALQQVTTAWRGAARILHRFGADALADAGNDVVSWAVAHWWVTIPAALLVGIVLVTLGSRVLAEPVLCRLERAVGDEPPPRVVGRSEPRPGPVPVRLDQVSFCYPNGHWALRDVTFEIGPGELLAVVGANGSGKSTLARVLCGAEPTTGRVERLGAAGLGRPGGTAFIAQRPETQVLGIRVADDVVWGLPRRHGVDIAGVLARVGLDGYEPRETSTLSGGELQRLAVAAALARRPALLVSDESTAMVDPDGRRQLGSLLRSLADDGMAVVHITHDPAETLAADRVVCLDDGRVVPELASVQAPAIAGRRTVAGPPVVQLCDVGHVYDAGTPWAHRALTGVDVEILRGERLLVVGANGSGKSTLASVLAGLITPTEGSALLDGVPVADRVGQVGLAFQHARLQVLGDSVRADVRSAARVDDGAADAALRVVGLDPFEYGDRRVDELSGGQLRRAALAGLLARRPRVLVLDEPLAGLDLSGRASLLQVLDRLASEGLALVVISHDLAAVGALADRTILLDSGRVVPPAGVVLDDVGSTR
jgi:energy-coupling factor transport system ATP-binding protein